MTQQRNEDRPHLVDDVRRIVRVDNNQQANFLGQAQPVANQPLANMLQAQNIPHGIISNALDRRMREMNLGGRQEIEEERLRLEPLSLRIISEMTSSNSQFGDECSICNEEDHFEESKVLFCGHKFHEGCIRTWFGAKKTCPVCRADQEKMHEERVRQNNFGSGNRNRMEIEI